MLEFWLALTAVLLIAFTQLLFKAAARHGKGARATLLQVPVLIGLAINGIAALCWVFALRKLELNYAFPLLCLNYLLVPLGARLCLGESLSGRRILAIGVIIAGVALSLAAG